MHLETLGRADGFCSGVSHFLRRCCWQCGHFPLCSAAPVGLSKAFGSSTVFSFHLSPDNSLCILNKDFILPTRRKLLTRCSWACRYLTSFPCCLGLLGFLKLLTTSEKHWHLPETVSPGLIYTHCYNYPLVPSGRTQNITSKGRVGVELKNFSASLFPLKASYVFIVINSV